MQRDLRAIGDGALGGALGTATMSAVMLAARRAGISGQLPPERITEAALDAAVGAGARDERTLELLSTLTHFGFGIGIGALFGVLHRRLHPPAGARLHGIVFATLVWLVSYRGWIPALGLLPPPERDRPGRPVTMVLAHWVYGWTLGTVVDWRR